MAKKAPQAPASVAPAEHVVTVREWNPHRNESVSAIHDAIDSWDGRRPATTSSTASSTGSSHNGRAAPIDHDELRAKVDRLTKHVKARTVTVTETVTELVEFEEGQDPVVHSAVGHGEPWDAESAPSTGTPRKAKPARKATKAASRKKR